MKIIKLIFYAVIGVVLALAGVHASSDWEYWVVLISVLCVDILSYLSAQTTGA